jgi:hypothetical protein
MKKIICLFLVAVLLSIMAMEPISAQAISLKLDDMTAANKLHEWGIFADAANEMQLERIPTRLEGLTLLIRLMGKEKEASAMDGASSYFTDVPQWGRKYANYAYAMKLAKGIGNRRLGANDPLRLNDYVVFILRALGYDEKKNDFTWANAVEKGIAIGLLLPGYKNPFIMLTRGLMARITYNALYVAMKNGKAFLRINSMTDPVSKAMLQGNHVSVTQYAKNEDVDYTEAIMRAQSKLMTMGGGTLVFPEGDYLIRPGIIFIPSNMNWLGDGKARIYTREKAVYNVLVSTTPSAKNISIRNIIFDQSGDVAQNPDINASGGCFLLHVNNTDAVKVENCIFYTYGVCAVLVQSSNAARTNSIVVRSNQAVFQRKTDKYYDVSVFNIDGKTVVVDGNRVESVHTPGTKYWKARTAYEVHMPNGSTSGNRATNTEVGILHVTWPMLWETYEADYKGTVKIADNTISGVVIGISVWGATTLPDVATRNVNILGNTIDLHLDANYVPAQGIAFVDGSKGNSVMENILVDGNTITMSADPDMKIPGSMNFLIPGKDVGAFFFNTKNSINGLDVTNNTVRGFPFAFLNLYRRSGPSGKEVHTNVRILNNTVTDCGYAKTHDRQCEALFNVGNSSGMTIKGNIVTNGNRPAISFFNDLKGLSGADIQTR